MDFCENALEVSFKSWGLKKSLWQFSCLNVRDTWLHFWLIAHIFVNVFMFGKYLSFL